MTTSGQDAGHHSFGDGVVFHDPPIRQLTDLDEEIRSIDPRPRHATHADPQRTILLQDVLGGSPLQFATVIHPLPGANWFRVQIGGGKEGTAVPACVLTNCATMPIGVRDAGASIAPFSTVIVWRPPGVSYVCILGAVPEKFVDGKTTNPCEITQGGQSGLKREKCHKHPLQALYDGGGVVDFNGNQAIDATSLDWGRFSETGIGIFVDSFQTFMRVNEACGLFLNWFDSHTRLSGINMDIVSSCHEICVREDEGEARFLEGCATYHYEALGLYSSGTDIAEELDLTDVQYKKARGFIDQAEGDEGLQPIYRYQEHGGYLGQGRHRMVMAPKKEGSKQKYEDETNHYGLWEEIVGLDGSYTVRSAKSLYFAKRVLIPVPKELVLPEDQKKGDDARRENYKFAGQFGKGDDHKIKDVKVEGEDKHFLRVAGTFDLLAYNYNWKGLHPFAYHKEDYHLPEESELEPFDRATDQLDFSTLEGKSFMDYPSPKTINVDERYGDVEYFQRESYLAFHEDGSVALGDGYGAQITMAGGQIRLEAPGDIQVLSGKSIVQMGWDIILKAKNSIDGSAANKDVRFKAEKNMQLIAGNSGKGGILLESKADSMVNQYEEKYGEDVVSSGIVMRASKSQVAGLAKEIYLRTGGEGPLEEGNIVIDASQGAKDVILYAKNHNVFTEKGVNFWLGLAGPDGHSSESSYHFGNGTCIIGADMTAFWGGLITGGRGQGTIIVGGAVAAEDSIVSCGAMASKSGGLLGKIPPETCAEIEAAVQETGEDIQEHVEIGEPAFKGKIKIPFYEEKKLGNEQQLEQQTFSFRDPPSPPGRQYKTISIKFPETRWQQMVRFGMGSGGKSFDEKAVEYQGQETMPWPGKKKWEEEIFKKLKEHKIFDQGTGRSKDRGGDNPVSEYTDPSLAEWEQGTMKADFKVIL